MEKDLRQNNGMSRYVRPSTPLPERVEAAIASLGVNPLRTAIFRFLWQHPEGSTSGDIGRALDVDYRTVLWHLRQLERLGPIASDAGEQRHGQRVLYRINEKAFNAAADELLRYIRGE